MSETEKPAEDQVTTAANGTGAPENTGVEVVVEKTDEMENGKETATEDEKGANGRKDEDVKMVDAADVKFGEEIERSIDVGEVEPRKTEGEEKEEMDDQEAEEKSEVAQEKHEGVDEKTEHAEDEGDMAEGKNEEFNAEKDDESDEKCEEDGDKSDEIEEKSEKCGEEKTKENEEEKGSSKKRRRGRKAGEKGEGKEKKGRRKVKEMLRTPTASSIDRPVRERKTVERLVEVVEKEPAKGFLIEKGHGTPLKDIPNVAYKLSKRKPADIKSLHLLLFGRKGKAINYKNHIFQFSGFVWHENEDKQRTKLKEKLDKCVKDRLLDFCDVFDIPGSRATSRKEELVAKLLDFMVSPRATTDVILADKEQLLKSRKRRRVSRSALRRYAGISGKQSRKKRTKGENASKSEKSAIETEDEDEEEEDDKENGLPDEDETVKHSETEEEDESEQDNTAKEVEYSEKVRQVTKKSSRKGRSPVMAKSKKLTTPKKTPLPASNKSPRKPYSKRLKADKAKNSKDEVFSRKKKHEVTPKKTMPSSNADVEDKKATGKKAGRSKAKSNQAKESGPTEDELRNTICEILKEVDFNTATFTDILKKLASHYNMDLTARKGSIKLMIQDELTKLADEAEDEDDSEDEGDAEKVENLEPEGKEVEA